MSGRFVPFLRWMFSRQGNNFCGFLFVRLDEESFSEGVNSQKGKRVDSIKKRYLGKVNSFPQRAPIRLKMIAVAEKWDSLLEPDWQSILTVVGGSCKVTFSASGRRQDIDWNTILWAVITKHHLSAEFDNTLSCNRDDTKPRFIQL